MNCNEIVEIYIKSLCSNISPKESDLLHEHIISCSDCRQALEWDSVIVGTLLKDKETIPKENFVTEICKQIAPTQLSGKNFLTNLIDSSFGIILTGFIMIVLWMVFNTEIINILVHKLPGYYDKIMCDLKIYSDSLPAFKIPVEISSIEHKNILKLALISIIAIIYSVVFLSLLSSSFSYRRR